jgi:hypothetical protein
MADRRFEYKNNQKKEGSFFASGQIATSSTMNDTLFTLPKNSVVLNVWAVVETASGTATDTIDVKVGSTVVGDEIVVGVVGVKAPTTLNKTFFATGGSVTVVAGADAPDAAGVIRVVMEYLEVELSEGTYTD